MRYNSLFLLSENICNKKTSVTGTNPTKYTKSEVLYEKLYKQERILTLDNVSIERLLFFIKFIFSLDI